MDKITKLEQIDHAIISFFRRGFIPFARIALFVLFFWFGIVKLTGLSPAGPLAEALTAQIVGAHYFDVLFKLLALVECVIGILFLIPKATRIVIPLLFIHMAVVCAPLVFLPALIWHAPFVPTLEGQYIIKNIVIVAVAMGIAANTTPLLAKSEVKAPRSTGKSPKR